MPGQPDIGVDVAIGHQNANRQEHNGNDVVSQFKGGAVDVKVAGTLQDRGTRYEASAGKVDISADRLIANAASITHGSTDQALDAKVDVRVYTKTGQDLNVAGSGEGGSRQAQNNTSTAVVGSYAGSQGVNINLGGDGQLEGSRFDGGEGGVTIKAGGELALNQANNRQDSDTSSLRGKASLTVGTLPGTTGANIDVGAGLQLDHAGSQTRDSQARVAEVQGKGPVQLSSGGDLVLQGTRIDIPGAIELDAGGKLDLQAATDAHLVKGSNLGGGLELGGSKTSTQKSGDKSGTLGINFNAGRVDESAQTLAGVQLKSQDRIGLGGDSIHLQGTRASAPDVRLEAQKGGIQVQSAQSTQNRSNWNLELKAGGNLGSSTPIASEDVATNVYGLNAGAKAGVDYLEGTAEQNSQITAGRVELNSAGDVQLAGARIDAGKVSGTVAGYLGIESRKDNQTTAKADLDLGLTGQKATSVDQDKLATNTGVQGMDYKPTLKFDGNYAYKDSVSQASGISGTQGVNLKVGGTTQLTGARIASAEGRVDLGGSGVNTTTLSGLDYVVRGGLDLPQKPATEGGKPEASIPGERSITVGPGTVGGRTDRQLLQAGIDENAG